MGEYQVIARKWRPQRFADVVGQVYPKNNKRLLAIVEEMTILNMDLIKRDAAL